MQRITNTIAFRRLFMISLYVACYYGSTLAKDFGKQGATFVIKEEGFVHMMQRKLKGINLKEHEQKMRSIATQRVEEPKAVAAITKAQKTTSHNFDPSYILDKDAVLPSGMLLYAAGTRVNPLDHINWTGKMVFIDARDLSQIIWIKKYYIKSMTEMVNQDNNKIILVGGKPLQLERETEHPIYFDQFGELTTRFGIAHVPAIVEQEGRYLKITETYIGN